MKTQSQALYLHLLCLGFALLLMLSHSEARVVKRYAPSIEDCQHGCNKDVYRCDLRCKYVKDLKGNSLKRCHTVCADIFLDCFLGCYVSNFNANQFDSFGGFK
ncbi:hypothetical protein DPMN_106738 [Dreissena polymorpha]|uniref:Uncharacterized protein n=1 Tax=Dreissena polymorpha TaxID=45954 RepID=A0A9D4QIY0_DREPO|nr:hypothetical protein DPMN_106738 [Dreissena polymorpha]